MTDGVPAEPVQRLCQTEGYHDGPDSRSGVQRLFVLTTTHSPSGATPRCNLATGVTEERSGAPLPANVVNLQAACGIVLLSQPLCWRKRISKALKFEVMLLVGEELKLGCGSLVRAVSTQGAFLM